MTKIYISYRIGQEDKLAYYIHRYFVHKFGNVSVFFDPLIKADRAFPTERSHAIRDADLVLVLVDKSWEINTLRDGDDWVRMEIQQALLSEKLTIPVILGKRHLLQLDDLPLNLQSLLHEEQQCIGNNEHIKRQLHKLASRVQPSIRKKKVTTVSQSNLIITLIGFFLVIVSIGFIIFASGLFSQTESSPPVSNRPTLVILPTSTSTSTLTPIPSTFTPTATLTPTLTLTSTLTPTPLPTKTLTPTPLPTDIPTPIPVQIRENGTQLVLTRGSEIEEMYLYLLDLTTGEERQLTDISSGMVSWSPNGSQILFSTIGPDTNYPNIHVINADGSSLLNLSQDSDVADFYPVWSPDGMQISFTRDIDGNSDIYVMNADGTNLRNITQHESHDYDSAWSPDGTQLVFTSIRSDLADIFIVDADGSNLRNLTQTEDIYEMSPSWSPDGTQIVYEASENGWSDIILINEDGSNAINLTNTSDISDGFPSWSPDGMQIVFHSDRDAEQRGFDMGVLELYIMNRDGTNIRRITDNDEDDWEADWQAAP